LVGKAWNFFFKNKNKNELNRIDQNHLHWTELMGYQDQLRIDSISSDQA
jgi:hypothetical protein